jgi:hypothetical protein
MWGSMLKKWIASEKQKVAVVREWLDEKRSLPVKEETAISELDARAQKLMEGGKEWYAQTEARADTTIKQQEDLNVQATTMAQWEQAVAD